MKTNTSIKSRIHSSLALERARAEGFKAGVAAAAEVAGSFDSLCAHPYQLADVVLAKLNQSSRTPRRNKQALSKISAEQARSAVRRVPVGDPEITILARAIAPLAWLEHDVERGRCSNSAGWAIRSSVDTAYALLKAGYRDCSLTDKERAHPLKEALRKADPIYRAALEMAQRRLKDAPQEKPKDKAKAKRRTARV